MVLLRRAIPYHSMPCRWPTPAQPNGCPRVGHPQKKSIILVFVTPLDPPLNTGLGKRGEEWHGLKIRMTWGRRGLFWLKANQKVSVEDEVKEVRPTQTTGLWQGVAMNSLKFHLGLPCSTLPCPAGRTPLKRPYNRFQGWPAHEADGLQSSISRHAPMDAKD
jgi:hypothetical protein